MTDGNIFQFVLLIHCRVLRYGSFYTMNTKVLEKIISGGLFTTLPQNTLNKLLGKNTKNDKCLVKFGCANDKSETKK